jgi:hypothetical protein
VELNEAKTEVVAYHYKCDDGEKGTLHPEAFMGGLPMMCAAQLSDPDPFQSCVGRRQAHGRPDRAPVPAPVRITGGLRCLRKRLQHGSWRLFLGSNYARIEARCDT